MVAFQLLFAFLATAWVGVLAVDFCHKFLAAVAKTIDDLKARWAAAIMTVE